MLMKLTNTKSNYSFFFLMVSFGSIIGLVSTKVSKMVECWTVFIQITYFDVIKV